MIHAYQLVVLIPYAAALVLVAVPGYRVSAVVNVVVSLASPGCRETQLPTNSSSSFGN